ncbi:MAG: hypothetical protein OEV61_07210 [Chloroflexota bacterium]|jgi:hypothetical protein|nr:hypothetical protein [Chloroflexota bacterium]
MERDPSDGGSDVGRDPRRDLGDEPPALIRDAAPDVLAPIDASSPVSGHHPAPPSASSAVDAPEHDWGLAESVVQPAFRPVGTQGLALDSIKRETLLAQASKSHAQPIVDAGPAGLPVVYVIPATGFDIVVNGDHVLSWGIEPRELQDAAMRNLAAWSATAPWTDETSGDRRLISSDTGDGLDAVRILLPETAAYLRAAFGPGRIVVGIPERHLLTAALLRPGDDEFAAMFSEFIVEHSGGADEPIDRRVFELADGRLVEFA